jgi:uridine kinase
MLITIDGVAGSGKTTLAQFMSQEFRHHSSVQVVHMDDLYEGWEDPLGTELSGKLQKIAEAHNNRLPLKTTMYDWESSRAGAALEILPVELLILEGVGSGQRSIREFVEKKIWIDLDECYLVMAMQLQKKCCALWMSNVPILRKKARARPPIST